MEEKQQLPPSAIRQKINQILEAQEDIAMACQVLRKISKNL
jgi:hypothetical protein